MSPDVDLEDDRIVGVGKIGEGLAALGATALIGSE